MAGKPASCAARLRHHAAPHQRKLPNLSANEPRKEEHDEPGEGYGIEGRRPVSGHAREAAAFEPRLVAHLAGHRLAAPQFVAVRPDGRRFRLREGIQEPELQGADQGPACPDDGLAGLLAGRLRPLRRPDDPPRLARRRHLPHHRRPRRRGRRTAAFRAAQQLAGQREPRQGAPPALADQAEVRPQDLLGGPHGPCRQRRPRVDGLQDLRLRRRAQGRLGAGRTLLGPGRQLARRRALQRRAPAP